MSSISSVGASTSKGLSGLVSGMDTESMVQKLLSGTQAKIDNEKAEKQRLLWKQESYRDVISSVKNLKDNYFDFLNPKTNISSNAFFQSMSSTVDSDCLSVVGTANAQQGKFTIKSIGNVATSSRFKSSTEVTSDIKINFNEDAYNALNGKEAVIKLNIDGIEKQIKLDTSKPYDANEIKTTLEDGLKGTGVTISSSTSGSSLVLNGGTRQVTMYADDQNYLDVLGVKSGTSNQIKMNMALKDINFGTKLQGSQYAFQINGEDFSFNENETIGSVIDKINSSDAGVEIKYSSVEDKFVISSKQTGAGNGIEIVQGIGNLMTAMFNDDAAKQVMSGPIDVYGGKYTTAITGSSADYEFLTKQGGELKINVDGRDYTLRLSQKAEDEDDYTAKEITDELNKQLKRYFGTKTDGTAKMSFELGASDEISLNYEPGTAISFNNSGEQTDLSGVLGLKNEDKSASEIKLTGLGFEINDKINVNSSQITVGASTTLDDLINAAGSGKITFDEKSRSLIVSGDTTKISCDTNKQAMQNLFGTENIDFSATQGTDISSSVVEGENAQFIVTTEDGTDIPMEKNVNNFTIDGLSITLNKATASGDKPIEITTTRDTEQILDGIVKFVEDYNKVIDKLNTKVTEDAEYLDHPPLTDAQRDELSESEIELWEEKSKEGLLRGDSIINDLLTEMRGTLYSKPEDARMALYDVGITTSNNYKDGGKLIIKEDVLRNAIENNSTDLQKLFASEDGIAKKFNDILDRYIKSSVSSPGRLVEKAGIKAGFSEAKNSISREIEDIEKGLKNLNRRYEMESTRYWKQFTSMEQVIQQMNSQSSWLMQQFG